MRKNDKMNRTFFGFFENKTTTTQQPNISISTSTTSPMMIESDEIVENIDNIEGYLFAITILIALILLFKVIKICKRGYKIHNERIIMRHNSTPQIN